MKNLLYLKRILISFMGFIVFLNCSSQTANEKRTERNELKKSELMKSFESLGSLIHSRTFVFQSGLTKNNHGGTLYDNFEYENNVIKVNGSSAFIVASNLPQPDRASSWKITSWYLIENQDNLTYTLSFNADAGYSRYGVSIKIFSDKTAIAKIGGCEFKGLITLN